MMLCFGLVFSVGPFLEIFLLTPLVANSKLLGNNVNFTTGHSDVKIGSVRAHGNRLITNSYAHRSRFQ